MTLVVRSLQSGIATVTLDSPPNRNALSAQLRTELFDSLIRLQETDEVRCIVLRHTGSVFCSGADLKEARDVPSRTAPTVTDILVAIYSSRVPVVAALSGVARAGGLGIVAACDVAVATESVTFACTEVRIGVVPAVISAVMRRRMGPQRAHEMFLTGRTYGARWASQSGLIDIVVGDDELDGAVEQLSADLGSAGPLALTGAKKLIRTEADVAELRHELAALTPLSEQYFASDEAREGLSAFAEKRTPSWQL